MTFVRRGRLWTGRHPSRRLASSLRDRAGDRSPTDIGRRDSSRGSDAPVARAREESRAAARSPGAACPSESRRRWRRRCRHRTVVPRSASRRTRCPARRCPNAHRPSCLPPARATCTRESRRCGLPASPIWVGNSPPSPDSRLGVALARPKSSTFTRPSSLTMTLAGLRSRCAMPCWCAADDRIHQRESRSRRTCRAQSPCRGSISASVFPFTSSIVMK